MSSDTPSVACPCGYQHKLLADEGFVTIRNSEWLAVLDAELSCREISGSWAPLVPESNPRASEFAELAWKIVERCGNLFECPECGRIMWNRPGNEDGPLFHIFVPTAEEGG